MADINVERKKRGRPLWPWIVAIILIVGIVWLLTGIDTDEEYETAETDEVETVEGTDQQDENPLTDFINFVNEGEGQVSLSHNYTQDGLQHLTDALAYLNNRNQTSNGNQYITQISNSASEIVEETYSEQHADKIRSAFLAAANFMQESEYPVLQEQADDLMNAAEKIKADELATNQANEIKNFFGEVADAFSQMDSV